MTSKRVPGEGEQGRTAQSEPITELDPDGVLEEHEGHAPPPPSLRKHGARERSAKPFEFARRPWVVKDLMSRQLLTVEPDTAIHDLPKYMDELRFSHLPVVEGDKLVGLVTRSDVLHASSSYLAEQLAADKHKLDQVPVRRIMRRELTTVHPDETLEEVALTMWRERVSCVPVVEIDRTLVGILTEADFLRLGHYFLARDRGRN